MIVSDLHAQGVSCSNLPHAYISIGFFSPGGHFLVRMMEDFIIFLCLSSHFCFWKRLSTPGHTCGQQLRSCHQTLAADMGPIMGIIHIGDAADKWTDFDMHIQYVPGRHESLLKARMFLDAPGCSWTFLNVPGCSWMFLHVPGCSCMFQDVPGCSWTYMQRLRVTFQSVSAQGIASCLFLKSFCSSTWLLATALLCGVWPHLVSGQKLFA